jgi:hypothetical protein
MKHMIKQKTIQLVNLVIFSPISTSPVQRPLPRPIIIVRLCFILKDIIDPSIPNHLSALQLTLKAVILEGVKSKIVYGNESITEEILMRTALFLLVFLIMSILC